MATSCFGRGTAGTPCTRVRSAAGAGAWRALVHARPRARSLAAAAGDVGGLERKTRVHRPVDTMFGLCFELFVYFCSRSSSFNEYFRQALRTARAGPEETCRKYSFLDFKIQTRAQSTIAPSATGLRHGRSERGCEEPERKGASSGRGTGKAAGKMARVELGGTDVSADSWLQNLGSTCWRRRTTL